MKKYKDVYGLNASIREKQGMFLLIIRRGGVYGNIILKKEYKTERGAKIALGRFSDGWRPICWNR